MQFINAEQWNQHQRQQQTYEELCKKADCYVATENYPQAEFYYRQAAVLAPHDAAPLVGLGAVAMQTGRTKDALRAFQTARTIDADCPEAYGGMAMIFHDNGKYPRAFEMYLKCLELDGDNMMALLGLFQTSCQMGTFSKIIHYLETYLDKHPDDHAVLFCLATLYAREGLDIQAKQTLLTVLAAEPDKPEAIELLWEVEDRLVYDRCQEVA